MAYPVMFAPLLKTALVVPKHTSN